MKRFLRYLLLVATSLLFAVWVLSFFKGTWVTYVEPNRRWLEFGINHGRVGLRKFNTVSTPANLAKGWTWDYGNQDEYDDTTGPRSFSKFGIYYDSYSLAGETRWQLRIPFRFLFIPLFLITYKLWYRPIKSWWRGTNRQGFAVEVNPNDETRNQNQARMTKSE